MIGKLIGNYRIVTELGGGAMGQVYFAEHTLMGRRAAIKVIRDELSSDKESVQRFINEARQVNRIGHPNIVEITDFGQIESRYYIMMELLEGETLEERLERVRQMDESTALPIVLQVADAVRAAHELGVVHRDLKPENIYLARRGPHEVDVVKVLDFGIAKLMHGPGRDESNTSPGAILGTPQYMSPEQCQGDVQLDHRSDIYSLAVVLYRMLTGSVPFTGDTIVQIMSGHIHDEPVTPRIACPRLSLRTETVILKALAKAPVDRFEDMMSFRSALSGRGALPPMAASPIAQPVAAAKAAPVPQPPAAAAKNSVDPAAATLVVSEFGQKRVGSRLAQILVERIQKGKLTLPSMPQAAQECLRLIDRNEPSLDRVARTIAKDPIIAPQIMRRARSALLGRGNPVRTIEQACTRLGLRELRAIIVDLSARQLFESKNPAIRKLTRNLWEHSVAVAVLSRALARHTKELDPESAYLAGLLHDVGKPIAAALLLETEKKVGSQGEAWLGSEAWLGIINECHREVGVALARSWDLHEDVLLAIARCERYTPDNPRSPASVVCFANALAKRAGVYAGAVDPVNNDALIREGQHLFKLDEAIIAGFLDELRNQDSYS